MEAKATAQEKKREKDKVEIIICNYAFVQSLHTTKLQKAAAKKAINTKEKKMEAYKKKKERMPQDC